MATLFGVSRHAYQVLIYHVVFATKRRAPLLTEANMQQVKDFLATKANDLGINILALIGYAAFTVSASAVAAVRQYIQEQQRHHEAMDYRGEMSALRKRAVPLAMG